MTRAPLTHRWLRVTSTGRKLDIDSKRIATTKESSYSDLLISIRDDDRSEYIKTIQSKPTTKNKINIPLNTSKNKKDICIPFTRRTRRKSIYLSERKRFSLPERSKENRQSDRQLRIGFSYKNKKEKDLSLNMLRELFNNS